MGNKVEDRQQKKLEQIFLSALPEASFNPSWLKAIEFTSAYRKS